MDAQISSVSAMQILDSRGNPTVMAEVRLQCGISATASAPSGASTGEHEARELRDGGAAYNGRGVGAAVNNVNGPISARLKGQAVDEQAALDRALIELDGTADKSRLGANALLPVSIACARAAARLHNLPLFRYLGGARAEKLPAPMMNILNGGAHADNNVDIQEFMIQPLGAGLFAEKLRLCAEVYAQLGRLLGERGLSRTVGDEGGYAPLLEDDEEALALIVEAIVRAGYAPGRDVALALDAAAAQWQRDDGYFQPKRGRAFSREELARWYENLCDKYPIVSLEDPFGEDDFAAFQALTAALGERVQIVGDDLFTTDVRRLKHGVGLGAANAILVKPNQIGTVTETLAALSYAQSHAYRTVVSHRSGETEDTFIADLAVATNAGQIKSGAPARAERTCKYNRLLRIERMLLNEKD